MAKEITVNQKDIIDLKTPLYREDGSVVYRLLPVTTADQVILADGTTVQVNIANLKAGLDKAQSDASKGISDAAKAQNTANSAKNMANTAQEAALAASNNSEEAYELASSANLKAGNAQTTANTAKSEAVKVMVGATASANGESGRVPTPAKGQQNLFLRGDGIWSEVDGYFVKKSGDIMTGALGIRTNGNSVIWIRDDNMTLGEYPESGVVQQFIDFDDKNNKSVAALAHSVFATYKTIYMRIRKNDSSTVDLGIVCNNKAIDPAETVYGVAPVTPANAPDWAIVTKGYSDSKYVLKSGDTMTGPITLKSTFLNDSSPNNTYQNVFIFQDKDGKSNGGMDFGKLANGSYSTSLWRSQIINGVKSTSVLRLCISPSGRPYVGISPIDNLETTGNFVRKNILMDKAVIPASGGYSNNITFFDKNNKYMGYIDNYQDKNGNSLYLRVYQDIPTDPDKIVLADLGVTFPHSGNPYAYTVTPPSNAPNNAIITKGYSDSNYVKKAGDTMTGNLGIRPENGTPSLALRDTRIAREDFTASSFLQRTVVCYDKNGLGLGELAHVTWTDHAQMHMRIYTSSGKQGEIGVKYLKTDPNNVFAYAPVTPEDAPSNAIITKSQLNAKAIKRLPSDTIYVGGVNASDTADLFFGRGFSAGKPFATFAAAFNFLFSNYINNNLVTIILQDNATWPSWPWIINPNFGCLLIKSSSASSIKTLTLSETMKVFCGHVSFENINLSYGTYAGSAIQINGTYRGVSPMVSVSNVKFIGSKVTNIFDMLTGTVNIGSGVTAQCATTTRCFFAMQCSRVFTGGKGNTPIAGLAAGAADSSCVVM